MNSNETEKQKFFTSLDDLKDSHADYRSAMPTLWDTIKSTAQMFIAKNVIFQKKQTDSSDSENDLNNILKQVDELKKNETKSQQGIDELDPLWHIWRYEIVMDGKPTDAFITYTDASKTQIAYIRIDDGQQNQKDILEAMRITQSLNGKIEKSVAQEDAAMRFLGDVLGYTLDKDGEIQKIVAYDHSAPSSWEAKDKLDFKQEYNNYFPLRDKNNPKWVPLPFRDSRDPTKVDVRTKVGKIVIIPGLLNKMLDLYAKTKGKVDRFGLTKQARHNFEDDIKKSIREHLEAIINSQPSPSSKTINFIESLETKHLRIPNDTGLIGQRGNELHQGLDKEEIPNIFNRKIMGFLNGIPYVGRKEIRAGEAHYPNMNTHTFQINFRGKDYAMNGSAMPSTLSFTNTAYDIAKKDLDQKRTNCYIAGAMVEFIDPTKKVHEPSMLPFFYGGRNLKGTLWVDTGSAHLKDIERTIFSSESEDNSEIFEDTSSPPPKNWKEIQQILKESIRDNAKLIDRFIEWGQKKQETPPQTAEQFATVLNTFFTSERSLQKTQEDIDILEDDLNRIGEAVFSDYEFDIDRPRGLAQKPLLNDEQDQSDAFKNEIKRSWHLYHNDKGDLGFLNSSFDAVFRAIKNHLNTSTPYTYLETQQREVLFLKRQYNGPDLQLQMEMHQHKIQTQFDAIIDQYKNSDSFQKSFDYEKERELLVIDCLNDIYVRGIISNETADRIQHAQRREDDALDEIITQSVGQITPLLSTIPVKQLPLGNQASIANHWKKELFAHCELNPRVDATEVTLVEHLRAKGVQEFNIESHTGSAMFLGAHDHSGLGYFGTKRKDGTDQLVYIKAEQMNQLESKYLSRGEEIPYERLSRLYGNKPDVSSSQSEEINAWVRNPDNKNEVKSVVKSFNLFDAQRVNPNIHTLSKLLVLKKDNDRMYFAAYSGENKAPQIIYANHNDPNDIEKMRPHNNRKWRHSQISAFEVGQEVDVYIKSELGQEAKIEREIEVKTDFCRSSKRRKF